MKKQTVLFWMTKSSLSDDLESSNQNRYFHYIYKALRRVENLFIQCVLFIHPRFVFIIQGLLLVVQ